METLKIEVLKITPQFYCSKQGMCDKKYICVNPTNILNSICRFLIVKSSDRRIHETVMSFKETKLKEGL